MPPIIEPVMPEIDDEVIYVHILPHSHNDAGWNIPYEGYYGQMTGRILNSVIDALF